MTNEAKWTGVGFILEYDGFEPGDVGFILNVPGGVVDIHALRTAAAAPALLEAAKRLSVLAAAIWVKMSDGENALMREAWAAMDAAIRLSSPQSMEETGGDRE